MLMIACPLPYGRGSVRRIDYRSVEERAKFGGLREDRRLKPALQAEARATRRRGSERGDACW
jgi:hypothetical protein